MPAPATATTAAIRRSCIRHLRNSSRSCPDATLIYPGHDYIANNLGFTMDREPDNAKAAALLDDVKRDHDPERPLVTSLGLEKQVNTFFRLTSKSVISRLREAFPGLPDNPSQKEVFLKLRELRNSW